MIRFRRKQLRRRVRPLPPIEDDGPILIQGHIVTPEWMRWNAEQHLTGFDDLPKTLRDKINYAETPERGALPTRVLVGRGGPFDREDKQQEAEDKARRYVENMLTKAKG